MSVSLELHNDGIQASRLKITR